METLVLLRTPKLFQVISNQFQGKCWTFQANEYTSMINVTLFIGDFMTHFLTWEVVHMLHGNALTYGMGMGLHLRHILKVNK